MVSDTKIYNAWRKTATQKQMKDLKIAKSIYKFKEGLETAFFTSIYYEQFMKTKEYKKLIGRKK